MIGVKVQGVLHEETRNLCLSRHSILSSLGRYFSVLVRPEEYLQENQLVLLAALHVQAPSSPSRGNGRIASGMATDKKRRFKGKSRSFWGQ